MPLLVLKKFRKKGNKDGAVRSFYRLQDEGFGKVKETVGSRGAAAVSITKKITGYYLALYCIQKIMQLLNCNNIIPP